MSAKKSIDIEGHVNVIKELWVDDFSGEVVIRVELVYPENEASDVVAALVEEALHTDSYCPNYGDEVEG